jgi:hypothetical protein
MNRRPILFLIEFTDDELKEQIDAQDGNKGA